MKRFILATQDHGAFIGTAEEVIVAWGETVDVPLEDMGDMDYEEYFYTMIIPNQDNSYTVYALDDDAGEKLAGRCWHCEAAVATEA